MSKIKLVRTKGIEVVYQGFIGEKHIGQIAKQSDGHFKWWPYQEPGTSGYWSTEELVDITNTLWDMSDGRMD